MERERIRENKNTYDYKKEGYFISKRNDICTIILLQLLRQPSLLYTHYALTFSLSIGFVFVSRHTFLSIFLIVP